MSPLNNEYNHIHSDGWNKRCVSFFPAFLSTWSGGWKNRVEKIGMQRVKRVQRNRKEMIYSKSFAGIGLHLHPVSPTTLSLSLCSIYISLGNCWVGSTEGFCCNWFKMQVVSLVVRKRRKGYPVSYTDSVCMRGRRGFLRFKLDKLVDHCNKYSVVITGAWVKSPESFFHPIITVMGPHPWYHKTVVNCYDPSTAYVHCSWIRYSITCLFFIWLQ